MAFFGKYALIAFGAAVVASTASAQTTGTDWMNRISVNGEVRMRFERDENGGYGPTATRALGVDDYTRVRARLGVSAKINDDMTAAIRLSTGRSQYSGWATLGSSNVEQQTLAGSAGGFGDRKDFQLDVAYIDYRPMQTMDLFFGKSPLHYWAPDYSVVWNLGSSLEGVNLRWAQDFGNIRPWVALGYDWALDRADQTVADPSSATDGPDIMITGAQAGVTWKTDTQWATLGVADYQYNNMRGTPATVIGETGAASNIGIAGNIVSQGNSIDASNKFMYDYNMINVGAEYGLNLSFAPVKFYADYVQNTQVSDRNKGMLVGTTIGALKNQGSWKFSYTYRDLAQDATVGAYSDIQFLNGSTDVNGSEFQAAYEVWQNAGLSALYDSGHKFVATGNYNYEIYIVDIFATF